jgi:hypothetical protein
MNNHHEESTYALLVRSEEKSRTFFETVAYVIFVLSAVFSILQLANHPVIVPAGGLQPSTGITCNTQGDQTVSCS